MELHRVSELRTSVLDKLQDRFPGSICRIEHHVFAELLESHACTIHVGQDRVEFTLRDVLTPDRVPSGRHTLKVSTPNTKAHVFRETKAGWFVIDHVLMHIWSSLQAENMLRQQAAKERQLQRSAEHAILRLQRKSIPEKVHLESNTDGTVTIQAQGLTEEVTGKILDIVREEAWGKKDQKPEKGLWDHLHDDDPLDLL